MYYGAKICFSLHISFIEDILLLNLTYRKMLALLFLLHLGRPDMHMRHDGHDVRRGGGGVLAYIVLPRRKGAYVWSYFFTNTSLYVAYSARKAEWLLNLAEMQMSDNQMVRVFCIILIP